MSFSFPSLPFSSLGHTSLSVVCRLRSKFASGLAYPQELLPAGSLIELERNKIVELTIATLTAGGPHPMYLHGHAFHVIRSAGSNQLNWDKPVRVFRHDWGAASLSPFIVLLIELIVDWLSVAAWDSLSDTSNAFPPTKNKKVEAGRAILENL
ncbi:hypothetical protein BDN72DRAFT_906717 [Pluteus cervinus]|uniref:Uncharacterized protein n=1 Tax=Pluteus cervinus TaxID=181527 RepID=A0ACD2ZYI6_9AGAR|nr:hypothetical protein BDN72DRAFT_906717 [Pluteus cervinus]